MKRNWSAAIVYLALLSLSLVLSEARNPAHRNNNNNNNNRKTDQQHGEANLDEREFDAEVHHNIPAGSCDSNVETTSLPLREAAHVTRASSQVVLLS